MYARAVEISGVAARPSAHEFTQYKDCRRGDLTVTEQVARETLTLPLWGFMEDDDVDHVIDCVTSFFQGH